MVCHYTFVQEMVSLLPQDNIEIKVNYLKSGVERGFTASSVSNIVLSTAVASPELCHIQFH